MTSKEYEQRLEALEREIAELRRENVEDASEIPPHPRWKPKKGEEYCIICDAVGTYVWDNDDSDNSYYNTCNVFKTRDAAKFELERMRALAEMREWAGNWDDPYELSYDGCDVEAIRDALVCVSYGELRFATKEDAENCIKAVGKDRLIKYYFGVRDHEIPAETE